MINPWVLLAVGIMWALSIVGASHKWASLKVDQARAEYLEDKNAAISAANEAINRLNAKARATENRHAADISAVAANYEKRIQDVEDRRRKDAAAVRAGDLRLRVPAAVCESLGSPPSSPSAPTGVRDGPATVELPPEITGDLFELANDADQVADQLRACQAIVMSDRGIE